MIHFLTTRRQKSWAECCKHFTNSSQLCACTFLVICTSFCLFSPFSGLGALTFLWMKILNTEMARWNSSVCWAAGSLKTFKGHYGLYPALLTSCGVVWVFVKAAATPHKGAWWNWTSQITPAEILVSGQPIISSVWNSLGEGGASSNTMSSLEGPEQAKAGIGATENSPLSNSSLVLDRTSGPTSMKTHFCDEWGPISEAWWGWPWAWDFWERPDQHCQVPYLVLRSETWDMSRTTSIPVALWLPKN